MTAVGKSSPTPNGPSGDDEAAMLLRRTAERLARRHEGDPLAALVVDLASILGAWHASIVERDDENAESVVASHGVGDAEGRLVVPLAAPDGSIVGELRASGVGRLPLDQNRAAVLDLFAARAASALALRRLERAADKSAERLRDLFDEAPIAYVHEDLQSRFIRANRAALRILGLKPEEVEGMVGVSLVPDTPDAQRRVREAFESVGRGTDTSGVVLELRRKNDGQPVWIQWWSRPDPSGAYTRTMFIDITERVLLEQEQDRLRAQNTYLREEIQSVHNFDEIVGRSVPLARVIDDVRRVASTDASVLITGETGTGKELIARAVHSASARRDKPLIKLNCAALPTSLVESELFGHEKGAFSGAIARRIGRFELAHGGTIFLDEVGEIPPDVQVKLLRVLQEREFERVGGAGPIRCDVRVIAATNRDLSQAMAEGRFREDLFYRLSVFPIRMPPLRERADDIPLLTEFFLGRFAARLGRRIAGLTPRAMARFREYPWPGNVRELENFIERAVILADSEWIDASPAAEAPDRPSSAGAFGRSTLQDFERAHIIASLQKSRWVIEGPSGAAAALGLHPNTLRSRMKKLGVARDADAGR